MTRAVLVNWHKYCPFGDEFFEPMLDFFLQQMKKYQDEYDMIYLLDSNWNIDPKKLAGMKATIIKTDPNVRYFDTYKAVLPQVKEDLVLFLDNDMVIYRSGVIEKAFEVLEYMDSFGTTDDGDEIEVNAYDVVSIIDTIGTMKVPLKTGNKFCPYFFATRKELLMKYLEVDWSPDAMPYTETFGLLTEAMLKDGCKVFEMEDDKSNILLNSQEHGTLIEYDKNNGKMNSKDLGYYHIRAGSTPAYLLATRKYGDKQTYDDYIKNQPKSEYLRQLAWYSIMSAASEQLRPEELSHVMNEGTLTLLKDVSPDQSDEGQGKFISDFGDYVSKFKEYHGLE